MKVIVLKEVEDFCSEHNFQTISLKYLREIAVEENRVGLDTAYRAGYGKCSDVVIKAMHDNKPSRVET